MCDVILAFVSAIRQVAIDLVTWYRSLIMTIVRSCRQGPCYFWCLCCDQWLCWIAAVLVSVIFIAALVTFFLLYVVMALAMLVVCVGLCIAIDLLLVFANIVGVAASILSLGTMTFTMNNMVHCFGRQETNPPAPPAGSGSGPLTGSDGSQRGPNPTVAPRSAGTTTGSTAWILAALVPRSQCGCREGAIGAVVGSMAFAALVALDFSSQSLGLGAALVLSGMVIGKVLGIFLARSRTRAH